MRKIFMKNTFDTLAHNVVPHVMPQKKKLLFRTFLLEFTSTKMANKAKWPPVVHLQDSITMRKIIFKIYFKHI